MTRSTLFVAAISGIAVLHSACTGNPWAAGVAALLFVFVLFLASCMLSAIVVSESAADAAICETR